MHQTTDTVVMISPDHFQFNAETASTNTFQQTLIDSSHLQNKVTHEFESMISVLQNNHIRVIAMPARHDAVTPDAVFPNNWFSIHCQNNKTTLVLYPMLNDNRRAERQVGALKDALAHHNIHINETVDFTGYENDNKSLEGTGSLVLDRTNKILYASLSARTDQQIVNEFAQQLDYSPICFHSHDQSHQPIYHTNVMLSVGSQFAVIALESIVDMTERMNVVNSLLKAGKQIIAISMDQMNGMAANILEVKSMDGKAKIIMSDTAFKSFTLAQRAALQGFGELVVVDIGLIEKVGGGSARCMLAEIFYE